MIAAADGWVYFTDEEDPCIVHCVGLPIERDSRAIAILMSLKPCITKPSHDDGDGGVVLQEQCTSISPFLWQQSDTPYLFLMRRCLV